MIISNPSSLEHYKTLIGDGSQLGINVVYGIQQEPRGIAEAFLIGEQFIGSDNVCLIFGDNIFYGHGLTDCMQSAIRDLDGATVFAYSVKDPERYGVVEFDASNNVISIEEKPKQPKSNWAVTGIYFYDANVIAIAKSLKPSDRGELEITDVNKEYLNRGNLKVILLDRGFAWLDTGTYDSISDASRFIHTIEERQGLKIGCLEEIAFRQQYIDKSQLLKLAGECDINYKDYLLKIVNYC
jgi:glucose-1-phosphate thymidylyltransferase